MDNDPTNFAMWINALAASMISSFWSILIVVLLAGLIYKAGRWAFKPKKNRRRLKKA